MTETKKKIIWTGLTVITLGLAAYSIWHTHKETFEPCFICGKEGWIGLIAGFCFCNTIYLYQGN